jgi:hypothetical protein
MSFAYFEICITPKVFTFYLESDLNIDKNRSTLSVGGFLENDALRGFEPRYHRLLNKRVAFPGAIQVE